MQPPERGCQGQETGVLCDKTTCFSCNCIKEANSQVVRGTILVSMFFIFILFTIY